MNIISDDAGNKTLKINIVRAYARTLDEIVTYKTIRQVGDDFLVLSKWLPDDNYLPHISKYMKNFKLKPECARLFSAEILAQAELPYLIPINWLAEGSKISLDRQNKRIVFKVN